jgi:peptidoglycan-associated lipoprotein
MTRKWLVWIVIPLAVLALYGCPKKPPVTPEEPAAEAPPPPKPVEEVEPAPKPEMADEVEKDPLDSEDLREVNEAAVRQGFHADVYFDFDKSDLRPEAREALSENARWLRSHPELVIRIEGHCDERGTNEYNLALGERRANAARNYIASLNVDAGRMQTISYGEERPVCTESTEACWQRNRRAHMVITGRR